jgi:hypothetical protein
MPFSSRTLRVISYSAVASALAWGLAGTAAASPTPIAARCSNPSRVEMVRLSSHGALRGLRRTSRGLIRLRVAGAEGEALEVVAPRRHATRSTLLRDYRKFAATGTPAKVEHDFRFLGGGLVGADVDLRLSTGTYYAFDAGQSTLTRAHLKTMRVRRACRSARRAHVNATITAIAADAWSARPASIPRRGELRFVNASSRTHLLNLLQLTPGTTLADVEHALAQPQPDLSSISTGVYDEAGVVSPRQREIVSYHLPAGTYAALDLWPDAKTGAPGSAMGMVRLIQLH